jgi:hypothetical protein
MQLDIDGMIEDRLPIVGEVNNIAEALATKMTPLRAAEIARGIIQREPDILNGGWDALARHLFDDMKHALRADVGVEIDVLWQVSALRKPLRVVANATAEALYKEITLAKS